MLSVPLLPSGGGTPGTASTKFELRSLPLDVTSDTPLSAGVLLRSEADTLELPAAEVCGTAEELADEEYVEEYDEEEDVREDDLPEDSRRCGRRSGRGRSVRSRVVIDVAQIDCSTAAVLASEPPLPDDGG